ncbi:MAG: GNAT family N-acetyltransferase [Myxococcota bacterium]
MATESHAVPGVRRLDSSELETAVETLALSFDDDPLFRFLLPDGGRRQAWLRWFHALALGESLAAGGAWTLHDGPELGVMALIPPGRWPPPVHDTWNALRWPTRRPSRRMLLSGLPLWRKLLNLHPHLAHLYVYAIGVHPTRQGRGLGGALLRRACALADDARVPAYLETANPTNLRLYERYGFRVRETVMAYGGPPVWTMERPISEPA